ncbi:KOW domain-containing RNA-binding protein [Paenibacillus faecalis]|uniref:KOW domain-containing RNA-binding protein n=1 Tax=Paenibacillus faecalis TaxID=2079532 RepID=UPI000D102156|nr:KOW domain-containing RNA-binding protein [Paenibacillus faecalis]
MNKELIPQIGQIVKVLRGRDADQYAVIVSIEDSKFVTIADGNKRKFDQAKKKNLIHLELQSFISSEVVNSLQESGRVTNGKLRFAINQFLSDKSNADQKGE